MPKSALVSSVFAFAVAGSSLVACVGESPAPDDEEVGSVQLAASADKAAKRGEKLFEREEFDGNGRTCSTCHRGESGTLSPEQIQSLDEDDALFSRLDSDGGDSESFTRLEEHGTIRVRVELPTVRAFIPCDEPTCPPGEILGVLRPADDLESTHIWLNRGIPTVNNIGLDRVLMHDGRAPNLEQQALGAVHDHTENEREPTARELSDIAAFQRTLFSRDELRDFADGGPAPVLPEPLNESEARGKAFLEPGGACGKCHSGPMLNQASEFHPFEAPGEPFDFVLAGELDFQPNPLRNWVIINPETKEVVREIGFPFPDPGQVVTTGNLGDVTVFKILTLWGVKDTAPYFHDNSAKSLEEVLQHYSVFFQIFPEFGEEDLDEQDQADILAYLQRL